MTATPDDTDSPEAAAAGFRLSLVSPAGIGKAWRPPSSTTWHCSYERTGQPPARRTFRYPSHVESRIGRMLAPTATEVVEVLYDGLCDPTATEEENRHAFRVGPGREMVWDGLRNQDDLSPWAMAIRAERAEIEGRRLAALATSEARRRREQDRARRQGVR